MRLVYKHVFLRAFFSFYQSGIFDLKKKKKGFQNRSSKESTASENEGLHPIWCRLTLNAGANQVVGPWYSPLPIPRFHGWT